LTYVALLAPCKPAEEKKNLDPFPKVLFIQMRPL